MIPQGSTLVNTSTFDNLIDSVNACDSCAQLQSVVNEAFASINAVKAGIESELASLTPVLALLSPPSASPGAIVTWLTSFITVTLTPMTKPTITYAAQLTEMVEQIAAVSVAINAAAAKFTNCAVSTPS